MRSQDRPETKWWREELPSATSAKKNGSSHPILVFARDNVCPPDLKLSRTANKPLSQEQRADFHLLGSPKCAFPYHRNAPPVFEESCANGAVSGDVRIELRPPELRPACRDGRVAAPLVSVPEAAVHEDHGAVLRKDKVRSTVNLAGMKPEAETARVQCPPESQLGLGVLSPDPRHHPGTGLLVHDIGHIRPSFRP